MAFMRLGSKSDAFHRQGQTWLSSTGLPSDVTIEVGEMTFQLHKFPLISRSGLLEKFIEQSTREERSLCVIRLDEIPGGGKAFELVTRFCYGVKIDITPANVVKLRCAAEYLQMTDEFGEGNLIGQTEKFLSVVFENWTDTLTILQTCDEVLPYAEDVGIVSRCIDSLAVKACADQPILNWPVKEDHSPNNPALWNGISTVTIPPPNIDDWWHNDVSSLSTTFFKAFILDVESKGMKPEIIASALACYATKHIPLMSNAESGTTDSDQRSYLEEIVMLLPNKKGVTSTKFLLRLLRTAMVLQASQSCCENLEKKVGTQLDQADLADLLIPNMGHSETLYDVECVQRMLDHFLLIEQASAMESSPSLQLMAGSDSLTPMTMVASLVDGYLAEVAPDVNLKLLKFEALAAAVPDYARPLDDGIYRAIDVYLKGHPWITDTEREQICRLMNCQKLSLEANTHAAQNERLPLRVIVQVLFFEQLRLRTSVSGWLFVSENLEQSQDQSGNNGILTRQLAGVNDIKDKVSELEKECLSMKQEIQKLEKMKKSWRSFTRMLYFKKKADCCNPKDIAIPVVQSNEGKVEVVQDEVVEGELVH